MEEIDCLVTGNVQGVTCRAFVEKKANALWLLGYVENTSDRAVRVVAQGPKEKLEALIAHLWKGPFGARVANVSVTWKTSTVAYTRFTINY